LADLAATIRMSTMQLQTLVDNLLESATIEAGLFRVQLQRTHIEDIIISAVQTMAPLLRRRNQDLKTEIVVSIPSINADPDRLVQVLVNLLANASKFGPMGEQISLIVQKHEKEIEVAVLDSGPGLPAGRFADLFKRFAMGRRSPRPRYGPGLGLSVVKAIVEAHSGKVGAENRPEGGARVWFTIPINPPSSKAG
jgi:two-component system sensor histidine kinase KdpD